MGRRKRNTKPLLVLKDQEPVQTDTGLLEQFYQTTHGRADRQVDSSMLRPSLAHVESAGRWEVEIDEDAYAVRGVRIYLPNVATPSRAYYPFPVHLDTAHGQRLAMRWLNQMMDMHYTLNSLERLYLKKTYEDLSQAISSALQQFVGRYQNAILVLSQERTQLLEQSGLKSLNGHAQKISFTHSIDFVAALSAPQDRYLIRTISTMDQLMALYDRAYLTVDFPQERYVQGTENAYRMVDGLMAECLRQARTQSKQWLADAESRSGAGSI